MKILIVGGGIAGLSLARALEQRGITADLVERQGQGTPAAGAGLYLLGNTMRALDQLGLMPQVMEKAAPIERQRILDHRGRQLNCVETEEVWRACGPCLALPRADMHAILQGSLRHTNVTFSRALADISTTPEGCEISFEDGSAARYDLVVGADGIYSRLRRALFPQATPRYLGNICWRCIIPNTAGIDGWTVMLGDRKTLLALPVNGSDVYIYGDVMVPLASAGEYSPQTDLKRLFAGFGAPVRPLLETMTPATGVHFGRIEEVRMEEWVKNRAVLIGDAAHASSPSMAEGAGMAIEDALVLAEMIGAARGIDAALAAYTARRRKRVEWVQAQCRARDMLRAMPSFVRAGVLRPFGTALYRRSYVPLLQPI